MLSAEIAGATETTVVNIVYMESLKRNVDPARAEQNVPPNLIDRTTIPAIPQQYQQTKNCVNFLIFERVVGDPERVIFFSSRKQMRF